jgi:SH3-like domain-containing protein
VLKNSTAQIDYSLYPDSVVANKPFGVVNLSVANLRTAPSHAAEMATQLLLGAAVDILDVSAGDYRVRTPEGYIAWVPKSSVVAMDKVAMDHWKSAKKNYLYPRIRKVLFHRQHDKSTRIGFGVRKCFGVVINGRFFL